MTAAGWVRSLQCKSTAAADVASTTTSLKKTLLPRPCSNSDDVILLATKKSKPKKPKLRKPNTSASISSPSLPPPPPVPVTGTAGPLASLTELLPGHSSRRVVEIIFVSSWSRDSGGCGSCCCGFPGEIEMLFKIHNPTRSITRFEDYRSTVRARASHVPRCAADGNEMMRFHCANKPVANEPVYNGLTGCGTGMVRFRTYDGSGGAHVSGGGGGSGRRAMLLCRVIAGRVRDEEEETDPDESKSDTKGGEFESVRVGKGELVVFDRRAVLPCFLIIYNL